MKLKRKIANYEESEPEKILNWVSDWIIKPVCILAMITFAVFLMTQAVAMAYTVQIGGGFKILQNRLEVLQFGEGTDIEIPPFHDKERVIHRATELIKGFEGFPYGGKCYKDTFKWVDGKKVWSYSQGYGHECIQPIISKTWSTVQVKRGVEKLYNEIEPLYPLASENRLTGLISYDYNTPNTRPVLDEVRQDILDGDKQAVWDYMLKYNAPQSGHYPRREQEINLIFNQ